MLHASVTPVCRDTEAAERLNGRGIVHKQDSAGMLIEDVIDSDCTSS